MRDETNEPIFIGKDRSITLVQSFGTDGSRDDRCWTLHLEHLVVGIASGRSFT
jgi:hypothetical protein